MVFYVRQPIIIEWMNEWVAKGSKYIDVWISSVQIYEYYQ